VKARGDTIEEDLFNEALTLLSRLEGDRAAIRAVGKNLVDASSAMKTREGRRSLLRAAEGALLAASATDPDRVIAEEVNRRHSSPIGTDLATCRMISVCGAPSLSSRKNSRLASAIACCKSSVTNGLSGGIDELRVLIR
jgi:hypothetical protein